LANGADSGAGTGGATVTAGGITSLVPGNDDFAYAWGPHTIASADVLVDPLNPTELAATGGNFLTAILPML
jgi:hypothetical protein